MAKEAIGMDYSGSQLKALKPEGGFRTQKYQNTCKFPKVPCRVLARKKGHEYGLQGPDGNFQGLAEQEMRWMGSMTAH